MILVGRGTFDADAPGLDVRLPGLEVRSPRRALLTRGEGVEGWHRLGSPEECTALPTSTTCSSRAGPRPRPLSSPPIWSTGCSSTAPRS